MEARDRHLLRRRLDVGRVLTWAMVGLLASFYFWVQIVKHREMVDAAQEQAVKTLTIPAPRGLILDRNGHKLVENQLARDLVIQQEDLPRDLALLDPVALALELDPQALRRKVQWARSNPGNRRLLLQHNLDEAGLAKAELLRARHPFLSIELSPRRIYFGQDLAGHLLGYVGEVSPEVLERNKGRYQMGEIIGKTGFEAAHNDDLKGVDGLRRVLVNNLNRPVGLLGLQEPKVGTNVMLTLDAGVQQVLREAFQGQKGAAVVLDLRDGGILGMFSAPSIDPNLFLDKLTQAQVNETRNHPDHPMENRAIRGRYPPGSTFKLFMALAALDAGKLRPDEVIHCAGSKRFWNRSFRCEHVHGGVTLIPAIAQSCNVFFYELGSRLDIDDIHAAAQRYGLVGLSGIDLPSELGCRIPSRAWKAQAGKTAEARKWYPGETISVAIGQGDVGLTPIGLARFYAMLGTRGRLLTPHLLLGHQEEGTGRLLPATPPPAKDVGLNPQWQALLEEGLARVVTEGTARALRIPGLDMVGKTGTAQVRAQKDLKAYAGFEKKHKDHAWFAGYAPRQNPQIAFAVIVENAGFGAANAAPVAKKVCEYWFQQRPVKPLPPPPARKTSLIAEPVPTEAP